MRGFHGFINPLGAFGVTELPWPEDIILGLLQGLWLMFPEGGGETNRAKAKEGSAESLETRAALALDGKSLSDNDPAADRSVKYPPGFDWVYENRDRLSVEESRRLTQLNLVAEAHKKDKDYERVSAALNAALRTDQTERTSQSFMAGVISLAQATEGDTGYLRSLLAVESGYRSTDPIGHARRVAMLSAAVAENKLYDDQKSVSGLGSKLNLDLGDDARPYFQLSASRLQEALSFAAGHEGKIVAGRSVDEEEILNLRTVRDYMDDRLRAVSGRHELIGAGGAFAQMRTAIDRNEPEMKRMLQDLEYAAYNGGPDPIKASKLYRDSALLRLAFADYYADRGDAAQSEVFARQGLQLLTAAKKADSKHGQGDCEQLEAIAHVLMRRSK